MVAYVNGVSTRILKLASRDRPEVKWQVHVIDDPKTVNAFATPGGFLYVYTGLILAADNEAELAGVMAPRGGPRGRPPLGAPDGGRVRPAGGGRAWRWAEPERRSRRWPRALAGNGRMLANRPRHGEGGGRVRRAATSAPRATTRAGWSASSRSCRPRRATPRARSSCSQHPPRRPRSRVRHAQRVHRRHRLPARRWARSRLAPIKRKLGAQVAPLAAARARRGVRAAARGAPVRWARRLRPCRHAAAPAPEGEPRVLRALSALLAAPGARMRRLTRRRLPLAPAPPSASPRRSRARGWR